MTRLPWRPRNGAEVLPALDSPYGGSVPGHRRCLAIGLGLTEKSDCCQERWDGSVYCYYHTKVRTGLLEAESHLYPVWPLPRTGYVLLEEATA